MQSVRRFLSQSQETKEDQKTPEITFSNEEIIKLNPEAEYTNCGYFARSYAEAALARCTIAELFPSEANKAGYERILKFVSQEIDECEKLKPGR